MFYLARFMDVREEMLNHYQRWNIELDEEEEFKKFKNRLINKIEKIFLIIHDPTSDKLYEEFLNLMGKRVTQIDKISSKIGTIPSLRSVIEPNSDFKFILYDKIDDAKTVQDLATVLQVLFLTVKKIIPSKIDEFYNAVKYAVRNSPLRIIEITKNNNSIVIYPAGSKLLDEGVVNDVLGGLENYPKVAKDFEEALKIYLSKETSKYRNLLDNLRVALEQLLKTILNNDKSLENQKNILLPWIKDKGLNKQVVNLYQ
ncbi:hypothetical protein PCC7424_0598 [Gloeothece citriformis PCC 7424]|uniref:Uncharacterized protein n=1 Tax=Gloeothece citriformis (strain PCC 7424) TaxID=65393 RepID=B7KEN4_GLOC7|nr:hypothetical protein [Gloeothece citriformis]ACK69059.1 hypothetical protein PCC7424_0598 [Gloeothece citriformis PCC 7424]